MLRQILSRLERARGLDGVSDKLQSRVLAATPQPAGDVLHGVWLGHPLHPVLVQVPVGCFLSAAVLDLIPGVGHHETWPSGEGQVVGAGAEACVVCPWHGSTFRLADGAAVHGPAANDQPVLRSRVRSGTVEIAQP